MPFYGQEDYLHRPFHVTNIQQLTHSRHIEAFGGLSAECSRLQLATNIL